MATPFQIMVFVSIISSQKFEGKPNNFDSLCQQFTFSVSKWSLLHSSFLELWARVLLMSLYGKHCQGLVVWSGDLNILNNLAHMVAFK